MTLSTYDLKAVLLTIGGQRISGFDTDSAITFEWEADLFVSSTGGDGADVAVSRINNNNVTATITLREGASGYRVLAEIMQRQLFEVDQLVLPIAALNFSMVDPRNGDSIASQFPVFMKRPMPNKEAAASSREFAIFLPSPTGNLFGSLNIV